MLDKDYTTQWLRPADNYINVCKQTLVIDGTQLNEHC